MPGMVALPTTSIHDRAHTDLATIIAALKLQGQTDGSGNTIVGNIGSSVFAQWLTDLSNIFFPCILLVIEEDSEEEDDELANFEQTGTIYYSQVLLLDDVSPRDPNARQTYLLWQFDIRQTLEGLDTGPFPFLPKTPECQMLSIKRMKTFERSLREYQLNSTIWRVGFRCTTQRWRGGVPPT